MSGIWGGQSALDLYLQENGITTLFFAGVNADQVRAVAGFLCHRVQCSSIARAAAGISACWER